MKSSLEAPLVPLLPMKMSASPCERERQQEGRRGIHRQAAEQRQAAGTHVIVHIPEGHVIRVAKGRGGLLADDRGERVAAVVVVQFVEAGGISDEHVELPVAERVGRARDCQRGAESRAQGGMKAQAGRLR